MSATDADSIVLARSRAFRQKEKNALESDDEATVHWFVEAVKIYGLLMAAHTQKNQILMILAKRGAGLLGDPILIKHVENFPRLGY